MPQFIDKDGKSILWLHAEPAQPIRTIFDPEYIDPDWIKLEPSDEYVFNVPALLEDEGPGFTNKEYQQKLIAYFDALNADARRVLSQYGVTEKDYEFGQIPLQLDNNNRIPATVYAAARIVELLETISFKKRPTFHISDLHKIAKIVEFPRVQEIDQLERDLSQYLELERRQEKLRLSATKKMEAINKTRADAHQSNWNQILKIGERIQKEHPDLSQRAISAMIEIETGVSRETIRKVLRRNR